jgi:phospholipid-binding lipoprotein MlaA
MKLLVFLSLSVTFLNGCAPARQAGQKHIHTPGSTSGSSKNIDFKKPESPRGNTVSERDPRDPFESWNRAVFAFNKGVNRTILLPFIGFYRAMPPFFKQRVISVLDTAEAPISIVNSLLQGKIHDCIAHTVRLMINLVWGIGGLFDVAGALKIRPPRQDFGKTLQKMAFMPPGPFIMIPFLGPSSLRDVVGQSFDCSMIPATYWKQSAFAYYPASYITIEANLTSLQQDIGETFGDPYDALRHAYFAIRGDKTREDKDAQRSSTQNDNDDDGDGDDGLLGGGHDADDSSTQNDNDDDGDDDGNLLGGGHDADDSSTQNDNDDDGDDDGNLLGGGHDADDSSTQNDNDDDGDDDGNLLGGGHDADAPSTQNDNDDDGDGDGNLLGGG